MGCCHSSAKTADEQRADAAVVPAAPAGHAALPTSTSTPPTRRAEHAQGHASAMESKSKTTNTSRDPSQTRVPGSTLTVGLHEAHPSTSSQPHSTSQQPSPMAMGMTEAQSAETLPAQSLSPGSGGGGSRAHSLMLPTDHTDMTASGKLRSSLRSTGSQKRAIPPKASPLAAPTRKLTGSSLATLGLGATGTAAGAGGAGTSMFSQAFASSGSPNTAAVSDSSVGVVGAQFVHSSDALHHDHAGHHGYGPLAMAAASGAPRPGAPAAEPDLDASTQLNSDTSVGFVSAAGAAPNGDGAVGSTNDPPIGGGHNAVPGTGSRRKKLRRQTSHKGLLSKLALQFPLIKASFQRVHRVFQRYHRERLNLTLTTKSLGAPHSHDLYSDSSASHDEGAAANPTNITITAPAPAASSSSAAAGTTATSASSPPPSPAATAATPSPFLDRGVSGAHHSVAPSIHLSSIDPATSSLSKSQTHVYLSEEISLDKLSEVLHHIAGPRKTFSEREVRELFNQADLDGSKTISFREFLIAVSIGYFLVDPAPDSAPPAKTPLGGATPIMDRSPAVGPIGGGGATTAAASSSSSSSSSSSAATPALKPAVLGENLLLAAPVAPPSPASSTDERDRGDASALSVTVPLPSSSSSSSAPSSATASAPSASSSSSFDDANGDISFNEIARGFRVVQKAFQDIDEDHSGFVDLSEMKKALFAATSSAGAAGAKTGKDDPTLLEARFAELDFNGDGGVNFPEFMYGFVSWVGFNDEEE